MKTKEIVVGEAYAVVVSRALLDRVRYAERCVVLRTGGNWVDVEYTDGRKDTVRPGKVWATWGECERLREDRRELRAAAETARRRDLVLLRDEARKLRSAAETARRRDLARFEVLLTRLPVLGTVCRGRAPSIHFDVEELERLVAVAGW